MKKRIILTKTCLLIINMSLLSCTGQRPINLGITQNQLAACPNSPNCVSSYSNDEQHKVLPFQINGSNSDAWRHIKKIILSLSRTQVITETADYLHAECSSAIFGFVDDLELQLRADDGSVAIRSASRLGYSDFDINRKRIENIRATLFSQGVIK